MNDSTWDVIVVGGGIAGCSAGALLANEGKKVLVLEKDPEVGGRCWSGDYKGYRLDLGGHLIEDGAVEAVFNKLGKELKVGPPGKGLNFWRDGKWHDIRELYKDYRADLSHICRTLIGMSWDDLDKMDDMSLSHWVREQTAAPGILELFRNIGILGFNIFSEDDAAASEMLYLRKISLMTRGMISWGQYPIGGFKNLVLPLAEAVREKGGEVRTGVTVSEVVMDEYAGWGADHEVKGVEIDTPTALPNEFSAPQFLSAPVVICTLPIWHVLEVIPTSRLPLWYVEKIERLKGHPACFLGFYAGVTKSMMGTAANAWLKTPRTELPGWSLEPSAYDPSLAPEGEHLVTFGASVADRVDWLSDRLWLKQKMTEFEADMEELYPDLKTNCLWKKWYVVKDFALLQKPGYVGGHRPDITVPNVRGLYCAGDTFRTRGIGVDAAVRSSITAVERILDRKIPEFENVFHY
jgi:phytoene dehydrogenase-like protein